MKKIGIFASGVILGLVVGVVGVVIFAWAFYPSTDQLASRDIQMREKALGYSCEEVGTRMTAFVKGPLSEIVRVGQEGGDWVYEGFKQHRSEIQWLRDAVLVCDMLTESKVKYNLTQRNDFHGKYELFSALDVFTSSYDGQPPHTSGLKPEAFEQIAAFHRDLTARSKADAP